MTRVGVTDYRKLADTRSIVNAVEAVLRCFPGKKDARSLPRLALLLASTIQPLPADATAALDAAAAYLDQRQTNAACASIHEWASRIDVPPHASLTAARERLIWIVLNRNSDFNGYGVEFTSQVAVDAGVGPEAITAAVAEVMERLGYGVSRTRAGSPEDPV